jgi:ERCC4-type nuclease
MSGLTIKVDSHTAERSIGERIAQILPKANVEFCSLPCADFVIEAKDRGRTVYVERKTLSDLCGSIASGRLQEQVERMLDLKGEADFVCLLLMGSAPSANTMLGGMRSEAVLGMLNRLTFAQDVKVVHSGPSPEDAAGLIAQIAKKLTETGFSPDASANLPLYR